jgi:DNA polymerase III epsilon subunit-like protein
MNEFNHLMLDLETFSTETNSVIASIGVVEFGPNGLGEEYYKVCYKGQSDRHVSISTMMWWLEQSEEARKALTSKEIEVVKLAEVLDYLTKKVEFKRHKIWSKGVDFDIVILRNAFASHKKSIPWPFYSICDVRTLSNIYPEYKEFSESVKEIFSKKNEVAHNALTDAKIQALSVIKLSKLKGFSL